MHIKHTATKKNRRMISTVFVEAHPEDLHHQPIGRQNKLYSSKYYMEIYDNSGYTL